MLLLCISHTCHANENVRYHHITQYIPRFQHIQILHVQSDCQNKTIMAGRNGGKGIEVLQDNILGIMETLITHLHRTEGRKIYRELARV